MGRRQQYVYHIEPEHFPEDFPDRLDRFRQAARFTWRGLARELRVSDRTMGAGRPEPRSAPATWFRCSPLPPGWGCSTTCFPRRECRFAWLRRCSVSSNPFCAYRFLARITVRSEMSRAVAT